MTMSWTGPFVIRELVEGCTSASRAMPPEANGVYLVSLRPWTLRPDEACSPLYVGSNTGRSARFRTRIGDLLADLFGFFGEKTGHHSGGQHLFRYCCEEQIQPLDLYIGWTSTDCARCDESRLFDSLQPMLNRSRPSRCKVHAERPE